VNERGGSVNGNPIESFWRKRMISYQVQYCYCEFGDIPTVGSF